jgi:hypothetical protein
MESDRFMRIGSKGRGVIVIRCGLISGYPAKMAAYHPQPASLTKVIKCLITLHIRLDDRELVCRAMLRVMRQYTQ